MTDYTWVQRTTTVSPLDSAHEAIQNNASWRLIATGIDPNGETILTYGWPWEESLRTDPEIVAHVISWDYENGGELGALVLCGNCNGTGDGPHGEVGDKCKVCNGDRTLHRPYTMPQPEAPPEEVHLISPENLLGMAWGLIANAGGGDWYNESFEWRTAARRWRDSWHATLSDE